MPLPFIIGGIAAVAGAAGVASGVNGAKKMKDANDTIKSAQHKHEENVAKFEEHNKKTTFEMDRLGKKELEILKSFEIFSDILEKIQNRPKFENYQCDFFKIPKYTELKNISTAAETLLAGIGGAAIGTAGGFAAFGASIIATDATLSALGGGALAAGGGGIALGSAVFGAATLGVGFLIGGIIFNITGSSLSDKADEAWKQMKDAEKEINKICVYLDDLKNIACKYISSLESVEKNYRNLLSNLIYIVNECGKTDWNDFTESEKMITENTVLFVGLLYNMCNVKIVLKSENEKELNKINKVEINNSMKNANEFLKEKNLL